MPPHCILLYHLKTFPTICHQPPLHQLLLAICKLFFYNFTFISLRPIHSARTDEFKVVSELDPALPGFGSAVEEHHNALSIFLVLMLLGICILLIHIMLKFNFHYVPESVVIIFIGNDLNYFLSYHLKTLLFKFCVLRCFGGTFP